jgi:hypothetical protein
MEKIGTNINNHYKVGHAAVVLVNGKNGSCHYFDFGRYHAPFGYGRVRDEISDPDLKINTKAIIRKSKSIDNFNTILNELYHNPSCHGSGPIYASYCKIQFEKAYVFVHNMKNRNPWKYGPFIWNGTNCSRFVRSTILSGIPEIQRFIKLSLPLSISPTPIGNVASLGQKTIYDVKNNQDTINFVSSAPQPGSVNLKGTLKAPDKSAILPSNAQWLAGEGAGSWFHIEGLNEHYKITRYDPEGKIECTGLFYNLNDRNLDLKNSFEFIHISHCDKVMIRQNGKTISLKKTNSTQNQINDSHPCN